MSIDGVHIKNRKGPSIEPWGTTLQNVKAILDLIDVVWYVLGLKQTD